LAYSDAQFAQRGRPFACFVMHDFIAFFLFNWLGLGLFGFGEGVDIEIITALETEPGGRLLGMFFGICGLLLLLCRNDQLTTVKLTPHWPQFMSSPGALSGCGIAAPLLGPAVGAASRSSESIEEALGLLTGRSYG
jgi:hypothetical protein